ncbi:MAG: response regulator [bacterium]|nr:response regulator [bacterium]
MHTHFNEGYSVLHGAIEEAFGAKRNVGGNVVPIQSVEPAGESSALVLLDEDRHLYPERMRSVLIVGDSPGLCAALARALEHPRLRVRTADAPARGLETLARESMDFVIAERQLPVASGIDFLEASKREFPDVARILLAGDCDVALIRDAINRCGVSFFLPKPWDAHSLQELLDGLLLAEWPGRIRVPRSSDVEVPPGRCIFGKRVSEKVSQWQQEAAPLSPVEEE